MATMGHEQRAVPWGGDPQNNNEDGEPKIGTRIILVGYAQTAAVGIVLMTGSPVYTELSG